MKNESKTERQLVQELIELRRQVAEMEKIEAERKRAEKEYQTIISTAMDGFWIADIQGNFLDVNDAYCRLIGYSRDELLKMRISDIEEIEKPEETAQRIQKIRETGGDRFETRQRCKDSRIVDIEVSVNYRKEIDRMFVFLRDITEGKRVEEALRRSEEEAKRLAQGNALVAEIGRIVGSAPNIDVVFERFTKAVAKLLPFDRLMINLNSPQKDASFVRYVAGIDIPNRRVGEYVPLAGSATAECMRTKSSLLIQPKDIEEVVDRFPGLLPSFESGIRSIIMVPLISEDQIIGIMSLRSIKPEAYTDQDVRVAESISSQIAGVVANAQLYIERKQAEEIARKSEEEAKRLAEENAVMAEIGQIISSTLNIEEVYERFAEEVHKFIPFDRIAVNIINPEERTFRILYVSGPQVNQRRGGEIIPLAGTGTEEVRRIRASVLMREENQEEILSRCPGLLSIFKAGFRSIMMVPLFSKNEVIGTLNLQSKNPNAYTEMELRLAERVGTQIAGAMANAQLFMERERAEKALRESEEEARRLAQENAVMAEIGKIISSTLDIEEVYERFAEEMHKLISFGRVAVNIIDPKSYTLNIPYVSGTQVTNRRTGEVVPLAGTGAEEIMRTRTSILIHEENREAIVSRCPGLVPIIKAGFQSIMMVPLISENEVIGVLTIQSTQADAYTERDLRLAERISSQIAGAIANALLFIGRKRSEQALRESEERYRDILESVEDGYYEVDIAGKFTFFNDSMCQILGYSKEEMMGMNNRQYTDQKNAKKLYQAFNKVFRTEQSAKGCEWEIIKKDGTKRDVDASVSLIKDISGNRIGFRGIVRDITERKQAEKEMAALQEQLRQSQKIEAIGQLAGGIAHDFNNAITLIKTCSQLALMDLNPGDPLRQTFEMIDKATQQSANLTRQLLAFSRRQIMEMKVLDLNSLLGDMDKMLHRVIGEDIELVSMLAGDSGRVKVDPGQMEQVVLNLVLNSRDAMPRGGKLTIETAKVDLDEAYVNGHVGVKPGRYVRIAVSDTGVGMTTEVREKIFEPFFTTKEKGKGTGLGLSTVYGIVKQSGGNIWVYSEPGKGTTFKVYLPRVDEPLEEERAKRIEEELPRGGETVLVAEDDGDVRNLVVQILRKQGYEVLEAANGGEAFMICKKHEGAIDLLVTDVVMPVMSGRELTDRLLLLHPKIKVLYMSGYTDDTVVRHGVLEEGVNFFQKPFSMEALVLKVREVLDK